MEIARAREILDPEHREPYESLEPMHGEKDEERQLCLNCATRVRNWISEQCGREKTEVE